MIFSCPKIPNTAIWTPQFSGNRHFMFSQTISDIELWTIPHIQLKSTNHKYSKISLFYIRTSLPLWFTLVRTQDFGSLDLRICCLRHILSWPQCSLRSIPFGIYAGFMVLGVFWIETGSFNSAVLISFFKILAKVQIYNVQDCLRKQKLDFSQNWRVKGDACYFFIEKIRFSKNLAKNFQIK